MTPQIAVVDASVGDTPAERNLTREIDAETAVYKASERELPPVSAVRARPFAGVVISGSQTSVYDNREWIHELTAWARGLKRADVPMLGICWGHQFLAQAFGGRVVDMGEYEIGYREIDHRGGSRLFDGIETPMTAFETHSGRVAELPAGAIELARNEFGIQAFRLGASYGVQFHPEYDRETAEWILESKPFDDETHRDAAATITDDAVDAARDTAAVFDNFVDIVNRHTRQPGEPW